MDLGQADIRKFKRGEIENPRFWSRFDQSPDLRGATVLDIGSGWGSLCVDMALAGAKTVVGLDLKSELVDFAKEYVRQYYPHLTDTVEFRAIDLKNYDAVTFDYIVSKDSFEHIIGLDRMLKEMKMRLKPGAMIYAGFGPLYYSPYGDHDRRRVIFKPLGFLGRLMALIPWGHLLLEPLIITMNNRYQSRTAKSMHDLGLNKMALSDYRRVVRESGLKIIAFRTNQSTSLQSSALSALAKIPFLENCCTHNIYCILEKSA